MLSFIKRTYRIHRSQIQSHHRFFSHFGTVILYTCICGVTTTSIDVVGFCDSTASLFHVFDITRTHTQTHTHLFIRHTCHFLRRGKRTVVTHSRPSCKRVSIKQSGLLEKSLVCARYNKCSMKKQPKFPLSFIRPKFNVNKVYGKYKADRNCY